MNSVSVNLYSYCSNLVNLQIFNLIDVGDFGRWICKMDTFFYFALIDANALSNDIHIDNGNVMGHEPKDLYTDWVGYMTP